MADNLAEYGLAGFKENVSNYTLADFVVHPRMKFKDMRQQHFS